MCTGAYDQSLIQFADMYNISWTAWAWFAYPGMGCSGPALFSDWSYTPTSQGQVVKAALLNYPWSPPTADAGADGASSDATLGDSSGDATGDALLDAATSDGPSETSPGDAPLEETAFPDDAPADTPSDAVGETGIDDAGDGAAP